MKTCAGMPRFATSSRKWRMAVCASTTEDFTTSNHLQHTRHNSMPRNRPGRPLQRQARTLLPSQPSVLVGKAQDGARERRRIAAFWFCGERPQGFDHALRRAEIVPPAGRDAEYPEPGRL